MEPQFRSFRCKTNGASACEGGASAQLEAASHAFYECGGETKISCVISGPMQKSQGADSGSSETCQIKVNVEFINNSFADESNALMNSLLLDQFPDVKEQLEQYCANMPSEAAAQHEREQRIKFLTQGILQQTLQKILASVILGNEGTQVMFDFTVIECDQDLLQALVNCAASALLSSRFQLKCVPTAICVLAKDCGSSFLVDPSLEQISNMRSNYAHKLFAVVDSQKEEFIFSSLVPLSWSPDPSDDTSNADALDLEALEKLMGLALSCGKKMHDFIIDQEE